MQIEVYTRQVYLTHYPAWLLYSPCFFWPSKVAVLLIGPQISLLFTSRRGGQILEVGIINKGCAPI